MTKSSEQFLGKLELKNPYLQQVKSRLENYNIESFEDIKKVVDFEENTSNQIISYLLELACKAQNIDNINIGRYLIQHIPKEWLLKKIEKLAEPLLQINDEWEYRRLLELYSTLDKKLLNRLAVRAYDHANRDIREAGEDFLNKD